MKIALLGGTGNLGEGLALRWGKLGYEIIVGSRKLEKAEKLASDYLKKVGDASIIGMRNEDAAETCDVAVFTIPWEFAFDTAEMLKRQLAGKVVISPLVPMKKSAITSFTSDLRRARQQRSLRQYWKKAA